jgi:hypothetical protein
MKDATAPCKVPVEYLKPMRAARSCAQDLLLDQSMTCLADVQRKLKGSGPLLLSMDRSFRCELDWLATSADAEYYEAIHRCILECLPTASSFITLGQACIKLGALSQSDQAKFAALRSQSEIQTVRRILDKMVAGVPPSPTIKDGGDLFCQVWDRLQYFMRVEIASPEAPTTLGKHELWGGMNFCTNSGEA